MSSHIAPAHHLSAVGIAGSPSRLSRSTALLRAALARVGMPAQEIKVSELPAHALLAADAKHPDIARAMATVAGAQLVLVATPIYKAAYSGVLKAFLDLLPQDGLRGKTVLPLATAGSAGHLLALDYAVKPVLSALGARHILDAVFAHDSQIGLDTQTGDYRVDDGVLERLDRSLHVLLDTAAAKTLGADRFARPPEAPLHAARLNAVMPLPQSC